MSSIPPVDPNLPHESRSPLPPLPSLPPRPNHSQHPPVAPQENTRHEPQGYAPYVPVPQVPLAPQAPAYNQQQAPQYYNPSQGGVPPQQPNNGQFNPYGQPQTPKKKSKKGLIIGLIAGGVAFILISLFIIGAVGLAFLNSIGSPEDSAPSPTSDSGTTASDKGQLSYAYGESSSDRMIGFNMKPLQADAGWIFDSSAGTTYNNASGTCHVIINHGYAPDNLVNTGDDAQASVDAIKVIYGTTPLGTIEDKELLYLGKTAETDGMAPFKYSSSKLSTGESAGIWGRVISGSKIAMSLSVICDSEAELEKANKEIESNVYLWPTETNY